MVVRWWETFDIAGFAPVDEKDDDLADYVDVEFVEMSGCYFSGDAVSGTVDSGNYTDGCVSGIDAEDCETFSRQEELEEETFSFLAG